MKRIIMALVAALLLAAGLIGCNTSSAGTETIDKSAFLGTWTLTDMDMQAQSSSGANTELGFALLGAIGVEGQLVLNEDGTSEFTLLDNKANGTWMVQSTTEMTLTMNSKDSKGVLKEDTLELENADGKMTFSKQRASASSSAASSVDATAKETDYSNLALGQAADFKDGMSVSVDAIIPGLVNYDNSAVTGITVTYRNNGDKPVSFNPYDWKAETADGVLDMQGYYSNAENELRSGELTPGGSIAGNLYFKGEVVKAHYYSSMFNSQPQAAWVLQ